MSNEITDRLHAQVKFDATPTILSQSGSIASVARTAPGVFDVTMLDGIAEGEETLAICSSTDFSSESAEAAGAVIEKISPTVYTVRTFDDAFAIGDPDGPVSLAVYVVRQP